MKKLLWIIPLLAIIFISACSQEPFKNTSECNIACSDKNYQGGECQWQIDAKQQSVDIGPCFEENSLRCSNPGQCQCFCEPQELTLSRLLDEKIYDTQVRVEGRVTKLGELECPCFQLLTDYSNVKVWYDLMQDDFGRRNPVNIQDLVNGDKIKITGELKKKSEYSEKNDFWMNSYEVIEKTILTNSTEIE